MAKIKEIDWQSGQPVTLSALQAMVMNDSLLERIKLNTQIMNINPSTREQRKKRRWLINQGAVFGHILSITPGNDLRFDDDGYPFFVKTYDFPSNLWASDYMPFVTMTPLGNIKMTILVQNVTPSRVTYRVHSFNKGLRESTDIEILLFAAGIKQQDGMVDAG